MDTPDSRGAPCYCSPCGSEYTTIAAGYSSVDSVGSGSGGGDDSLGVSSGCSDDSGSVY